MDEWYDHPGTKYFLEIVESRVDQCANNKTDVYYEGEPFRTQEVICRLSGAYDELNDIRADIEGKTIEQLDPDYVEPDYDE